MKSHNFTWAKGAYMGLSVDKVDPSLSHNAPSTGMLDPEPICHRAPCLTTTFELNMFPHT